MDGPPARTDQTVGQSRRSHPDLAERRPPPPVRIRTHRHRPATNDLARHTRRPKLATPRIKPYLTTNRSTTQLYGIVEPASHRPTTGTGRNQALHPGRRNSGLLKGSRTDIMSTMDPCESSSSAPSNPCEQLKNFTLH